MRYLKSGLIVVYLLLIHIAIVGGYFRLAAVLLTAMGMLLLWPMTPKPGLRLALSTIFALLLILAFAGKDLSEYAVFAAPVIINILLGLVFLYTLLPGKVALVTRFARLVRNQTSLKVEAYTRRVTLIWTFFFFLLALESFLLAVYAPLSVWSLFVNFINYILTASFFVIEFLLRRVFLQGEEITSLGDYFRGLSDINYQDALKDEPRD